MTNPTFRLELLQCLQAAHEEAKRMVHHANRLPLPLSPEARNSVVELRAAATRMEARLRHELERVGVPAPVEADVLLESFHPPSVRGAA